MNADNPRRIAPEATDSGDLQRRARVLLDTGYRLALVAAHHDSTPEGEAIRIVHHFAAPGPDRSVELQTILDGTRPVLPSLAPISFPAGRFEREIQDLFGVRLDGHHQPARLVLHQHWPDDWHPMRHDAGVAPGFGNESTSYPFLEAEGTGVYEIPVGPVHAGVIEPGHFRFSVVGETILTMKARLWFVHKGIERLFQGRHVDAGVELAERISGDTAIGHNLAYCLAVEQAADATVPEQAHVLRAIVLELERLYNHVTDLGAMANDVAFGIAHAHTMRLREQLLRLNEATTGHRFLRGAVVPGGARAASLPTAADLVEIRDQAREIIDIITANATVRDRFTGTATLSLDDARHIGVLGYVARASGVNIDARRDHPFAPLYTDLTVPVLSAGDVLSRFMIRAAEIDASVDLVKALLPEASPGVFTAPLDPRSGPRHGTALVEAWRGTVAHRVEIAPDGVLARVKVVDPSFFNWPALRVALAGDTIVPDFPLANKSFNLSYAGNDL